MSKKKHKSKARYWHDLYYDTLKICYSQRRKIESLENQLAENQQRSNRERLYILTSKKGVYI